MGFTHIHNTKLSGFNSSELDINFLLYNFTPMRRRIRVRQGKDATDRSKLRCSKTQAVQMIEKLTVEERTLFLKEIKKVISPDLFLSQESFIRK